MRIWRRLPKTENCAFSRFSCFRPLFVWTFLLFWALSCRILRSVNARRRTFIGFGCSVRIMRSLRPLPCDLRAVSPRRYPLPLLRACCALRLHAGSCGGSASGRCAAGAACPAPLPHNGNDPTGLWRRVVFKKERHRRLPGPKSRKAPFGAWYATTARGRRSARCVLRALRHSASCRRGAVGGIVACRKERAPGRLCVPLAVRLRGQFIFYHGRSGHWGQLFRGRFSGRGPSRRCARFCRLENIAIRRSAIRFCIIIMSHTHMMRADQKTLFRRYFTPKMPYKSI